MNKFLESGLLMASRLIGFAMSLTLLVSGLGYPGVEVAQATTSTQITKEFDGSTWSLVAGFHSISTDTPEAISSGISGLFTQGQNESLVSQSQIISLQGSGNHYSNSALWNKQINGYMLEQYSDAGTKHPFVGVIGAEPHTWTQLGESRPGSIKLRGAKAFAPRNNAARQYENGVLNSDWAILGVERGYLGSGYRDHIYFGLSKQISTSPRAQSFPVDSADKEAISANYVDINNHNNPNLERTGWLLVWVRALDQSQIRLDSTDRIGPYPLGVSLYATTRTGPPLPSGRQLFVLVCLGENHDFIQPGNENPKRPEFQGGCEYFPATGTVQTAEQVERWAKERVPVGVFSAYLYERTERPIDDEWGVDPWYLSAPSVFINRAPYVNGSAYLGVSSTPAIQGLNQGVWYSWYICPREQTGIHYFPSSCDSLPEQPSEGNRSFSISSSKYMGKYLVASVSGSNWVYTTATAGKIAKVKPLVEYTSTDPDDGFEPLKSQALGSTLRARFEVPTSDALGFEWYCPKTATVTIENRAWVTKTRRTIRLVRDGQLGGTCLAKVDTKLQGNVKITLQLPSTSRTIATSKTIWVKAEPKLTATVPKRAFDRYSLSLRASAPTSTSCNVREEYYSFEGTLLSTRWFKVKLSGGRGYATRTPSYVGVIRGMVTCESNSKYGVAIDTYKLFSY